MPDPKTQTSLITSARKIGDALVIAIKGEIDLHISAELRTAILDLLTREQPKKLVLNLAQVPYMDSSAIAVLVEALQRV